MCDRLATELAHLDHHADPEEVDRRIEDHQRWHRTCPHDYDPGHLPREPERPTP